MQEKKTLTFVVPAYNMTEYLERCVESLIASKRNDDIEVLIVDDGSSDGTLEMAKTFEARNPGIVRAIHQENKGHGGAVVGSALSISRQIRADPEPAIPSFRQESSRTKTRFSSC